MNKLQKHARELRNNSTLGEVLLWKTILRARKMHGLQFNRQFVIDNYIVDFIARKIKLVIEVDGYSHQFKVEKDQTRDHNLKEKGYSVLRFTENQVRHDIDNVRTMIEHTVLELINQSS